MNQHESLRIFPKQQGLRREIEGMGQSIILIWKARQLLAVNCVVRVTIR